jgi:hypothetical protein
VCTCFCCRHPSASAHRRVRLLQKADGRQTERADREGRQRGQTERADRKQTEGEGMRSKSKKNRDRE